jgi:tRNA threonylcarbamoyl adenosine modification protein YjeE
MEFQPILSIEYQLQDIKSIAEKIIQLLSITEGNIVILSGEPGVGKSTLCNALISLLDGAESLTQSPTFTKVQEYNRVIHMDLYMMESSSKYMDYLTNFRNKILLIEWGMDFRQHLQANFLIEIFYPEKNEQSTRKIILHKT